MTPDEALQAPKIAVFQRRVRFVVHADAERREANMQREDVRHAITTATQAVPDPPPDTKFRFLGGKDLDGDPVERVVGQFDESGLLRIVTVM
jgi:hypothetical protein